MHLQARHHGRAHGVRAADRQVEIDDRELLGPRVHQRENGRVDVVYPRESQAFTLIRIDPGVGAAHLAGGDVGPAHEAVVVVEQEVALRFAFAHKNGGQISRPVLRPEPGEVEIGEDVDVVDEERLVRVGGVGRSQQRLRVPDAAARFAQQIRLVGEGDLHAETVVRRHIVADLVGEMMDVDHDVVVAGGDELVEDVPQQRLAAYGHQRLGHRVGQGFEPRAEAGGENQGFHRLTALSRSPARGA